MFSSFYQCFRISNNIFWYAHPFLHSFQIYSPFSSCPNRFIFLKPIKYSFIAHTFMNVWPSLECEKPMENWLSTVSSCLDRGRTSCLGLSLLYDGILSILSLWRSCVCCINCCEFICANIVSLWLSAIYGSYYLPRPHRPMITETWEQSFDIDVDLKLSIVVSFSLQLEQLH